MLEIIQSVPESLLDFCTALGAVYMVPCTIFVTVCAIKGDISIHMSRDWDEKEKEQ